MTPRWPRWLQYFVHGSPKMAPDAQGGSNIFPNVDSNHKAIRCGVHLSLLHVVLLCMSCVYLPAAFAHQLNNKEEYRKGTNETPNMCCSRQHYHRWTCNNNATFAKELYGCKVSADNPWKCKTHTSNANFSTRPLRFNDVRSPGQLSTAPGFAAAVQVLPCSCCC